MKTVRLFFALLIFATTSQADDEKVSRLIYLPSAAVPDQKLTAFADSLPELGAEPLWDLRPILSQWDIKVQPDDIVIWSPAAARVFARASRETIKKLEALFEPLDCGHGWIDAEFFISESPPGESKSHPFRLTTRCFHGQRKMLTSTDSVFDIRIELEPVSAADGKWIELILKLEGRNLSEKVKIEIADTFTMQVGEAKTLWRSTDGRYELSAKLNLDWEPSVPKVEQDPKLLKAIETRLERQKP